jgi:hypothetical protein
MTCRRITLSSEAPWAPYSETFAQEEQAYDCMANLTRGEFYSHDGQLRAVRATSSHDRRSTIDAPTLARRWGTSVLTAANTLRSTMSHAVWFYPQANSFSGSVPVKPS